MTPFIAAVLLLGGLLSIVISWLVVIASMDTSDIGAVVGMLLLWAASLSCVVGGVALVCFAL